MRGAKRQTARHIDNTNKATQTGQTAAGWYWVLDEAVCILSRGGSIPEQESWACSDRGQPVKTYLAFEQMKL